MPYKLTDQIKCSARQTTRHRACPSHAPPHEAKRPPHITLLSPNKSESSSPAPTAPRLPSHRRAPLSPWTSFPPSLPPMPHATDPSFPLLLDGHAASLAEPRYGCCEPPPAP